MLYANGAIFRALERSCGYLGATLTRCAMKVIIQIPCFDEEAHLAATVRELPRSLPGVDVLELLVIDDGSRDRTAEVAIAEGVHHLVRNKGREGLARAYARGIDACLRLDADIIVNTDADNQYDPAGIQALVQPILEGTADIVVGDRAPGDLVHFGSVKRGLSSFGSRVVGWSAGADIPDAASGFRAISRDAALRLFVANDFTYTHETLIQAARRRMAIAHVQVVARATPRASRLSRNKWTYVASSATVIARAYVMYRPLTVFVGAGLVLGLAGFAIGVRFLVFYFTGSGAGHVQSLLLGVLLLMMGFQSMLMGLLAEATAGNRRLLEEVLWRTRALETRSSLRADATGSLAQRD